MQTKKKLQATAVLMKIIQEVKQLVVVKLMVRKNLEMIIPQNPRLEEVAVAAVVNRVLVMELD